MPNHRHPLDIELIIHLYHHEKWSLSRLGKRFGCHAQTILNRMREHGVCRRSLKEALPLIVRTPEWCNRIGVANRGKRLSESTRAKMSESMKGRPGPNKGLRKATHPHLVKGGLKGEKHPQWKGGISSENALIRQSSEYKAWRDQVYSRDDWTCVRCRKRGGCINADHIKPFSTHPELRFDVSNGQTLCCYCHKERTAEQRRNGEI